MKLRRPPLAATLLALCSMAQANYPSFGATALPFSETGYSLDWTGLNDYGQVIGNLGNDAMLWTPQNANGLSGVFTTLGRASAVDINNFGEVLLQSGGTQLWRPSVVNGTQGALTPLLPNFVGLSMNDTGQILGRQGGNPFPRVLTPGPAGYVVTELRTNDQLQSRINNFGQVASASNANISSSLDSFSYAVSLYRPTVANATTYNRSTAIQQTVMDNFDLGEYGSAIVGVRAALSAGGAVSASVERCDSYSAPDYSSFRCFPGGGDATFNPSSPNGTTGTVQPGSFNGPESTLHYVTGDVGLAAKGSTAAAVLIESLLNPASAAAFEAEGLNINYIIDMNSAGQLLAHVGGSRFGSPFYLLTPAGASAELPMLPGTQLPARGGGTTFEFAVTVQGGARFFFDPPVAVGYEYESLSGPSFASVLLPDIGDGKYRLELWNGSAWVDAGVELEAGVSFDFLAGVSADGVRKFRILGIETDVALDPSDPNAFVTGLTFTGSGELKLTQTSLTVNVPIPEPSTYAMFVAGLLLLRAAVSRTRTASSGRTS